MPAIFCGFICYPVSNSTFAYMLWKPFTVQPQSVGKPLNLKPCTHTELIFGQFIIHICRKPTGQLHLVEVASSASCAMVRTLLNPPLWDSTFIPLNIVWSGLFLGYHFWTTYIHKQSYELSWVALVRVWWITYCDMRVGQKMLLLSFDFEMFSSWLVLS